MADTSLGRASLSVTADLSGFTSSLDTASAKVQVFGNTSVTAALDANKITTATEKVTLSLEQLQAAAVSGSINATMFKQTSAAAKLAVDQMVLLDGATLLLAKDENELQFQTAKLNTGYKELENNLLKNDAAFKNNTLLIELNTQKQKLLALENKNVIASMMAVDDQAIGYAASTKTLNAELDINARKLELQARQMMLDTGATKALHDELVKLEEQEKALALAEDKVKGINQPVPIIEPPKVDTNTPEFVQEQINLKSETDLATKALELQARQMNVDSGATKKLHDEMVRLEQIEQKLIAAENKARGIPPPLPIKPPPIPENKNTAAFVLNAKKMASETDLLNKKLDQQARQMMIDSGAAAKLAQELSALEKAEKKLADAEAKINAAAGRGQAAKEKVKAPPKIVASSGGLKITDMIGIGFFTAVFDRMFTSVGNVIGAVGKLGTDIIDAGAKFQQVDIRLGALTGVSGMAQGLQDIMKSGPSASFETLAEHATRLAALKFDANSVQVLTSQFNKLGIALGNPEKIMALIVDKIGDMASEGFATTAALDKLAEEGVNAYSVLAMRMQISEAEAKAAVAAGTVSVAEASSAIAMLANDPKHIEGFAKTANSFYGIWQTASNNILALFQKIGGYFVEGFSLVKLSDTITQTFKSIGNKLDELKPYFLKFGVFVSSVFKIIGNSVDDFFKGWVGKADEFNIEELMKTAKIAALEFGSSLLESVKLISIGMIELLNNTKELIHSLMKLKGIQGQSWGDWFKHLAGLDPHSGAKRQLLGMMQDKPVVPISTDKVEKFFNDQINKLDALKREAAKPIEFGPPKSLMGGDPLEKPKSELRELVEFYKANAEGLQDNVGEKEFFEKVGRLRNSSQEMAKILDRGDIFNKEKVPLLDAMLDKLEPKVKNAADAFKDLNDEINRKEPPKWEKFLADNLTPLQIYQNELKKLNGLLDPAEGPNGLKAFALGSANAIAKLKQATGLGGPQQFASAVQAGSAAEFQVKVDEMGKAKNVQEEIRQLMEAAAEVEAQQLEAAREIAEAIKNLPAAMPKPQAIAVALNP